MLSGTGTLSSALTLLITGRAERSGDAVNLATAARYPDSGPVRGAVRAERASAGAAW
jgi:hypothetical protein